MSHFLEYFTILCPTVSGIGVGTASTTLAPLASLALHWHCSGTALALLWHCSGTARTALAPLAPLWQC